MNITLRLETKQDEFKVENLTREAFWGYLGEKCDEHYLAHLLRKSPAFVKELCFVAEVDGQIAGNVMYSKAKVVDENKNEHELLTFGPLSVLPKYRHMGIGSALMKKSILTAKTLSYKGIVFYGHPDYYPRFGFQNAGEFGITSPDGSNFDALMAMELYDGALSGVKGKFYEDECFDIKGKACDEYDKNFPFKLAAKMADVSVLVGKLSNAAYKEIISHGIKNIADFNRVSGREMLMWDNIFKDELLIINSALSENGYCEKLFPECDILKNARNGIRVLEK